MENKKTEKLKKYVEAKNNIASIKSELKDIEYKTRDGLYEGTGFAGKKYRLNKDLQKNQKIIETLEAEGINQ